MNKRSFVTGIVRGARDQGNRIWEQLKQVRDRASMAHLEQMCGQMGQGVGREALSRALAVLEERRGAEECPRCGRPVQRQRSGRVYQTLVGDVEVRRWYFYCRRCRRGWAPLDGLLEGEGRLSTGLQAKVCEVGTEWGFARASKKLWRLCGLRVSATAIGKYTRAWASRSTQTAWRPDGWRIDPQEALHLSIDAGKVNTIEQGWRDMKIAYLYDDVQKRRHYVVGIEPAERFAPRVRAECARKGLQATDRLFLRADGADWIWKLADAHLPGSVQIVDFYHVAAQIAAFAREVFGEGTSRARRWLDRQLHRLKHLGPKGVLESLDSLVLKKKTHRTARRRLIGYITPRIHRMDYPSYIANGWDIGSGPVESACKEIISARLKRGCRWKTAHAVAVANLRALFLSDQWDAFWNKALSA